MSITQLVSFISKEESLGVLECEFRIFAVYNCQDGHLRILKWPSLEIVLDRADAHDSVKDLDFR